MASAVVVAVFATLVGSDLALSFRRDTGPLNVTVAAACFLVSLVSFRSPWDGHRWCARRRRGRAAGNPI